MCDPLLVDWPWGPMASLLRDKDIQEKLPSRKTNLRKIIDSTHRGDNTLIGKIARCQVTQNRHFKGSVCF